VSSYFGELDTTPTDRHLQSQQKTNGQRLLATSRQSVEAHIQSSRPISDDLDNGSDVDDLLGLDTVAAGSELSPQTRCNTPDKGETPNDIWDFGPETDGNGSSLPPLSSPRSGLDNLPDTVPIPPDQEAVHPPQNTADTQPGFDLSETASTLRRSSPFEADETRNTLWDFGETPMRRSPSDFAT
jgi:hypothetical protein